MHVSPKTPSGLVFIGSMLGRNPGFTTPMGEIIAGLLERDGYPIILCSNKINRLQRIADIVFTLVRARSKADIQVLQVYSGLSFIMEDTASAIGKICGYRIIMHLHGGGMPEFFKKNPRWVKKVLGRADKIIVPSSFLGKALSQIGVNNWAIIPNVVDLEQYRFRSRNRILPKFLWMRAFHPIYNPIMAIKAFNIIQEKYQNSSMIMAGQDKGLLEPLQNEVERLGLSQKICFPGYLEMGRKVEALNASDVFLNTNNIDNAPVSLIEACACGIPIVATSAGGVPDLLEDGVNALFVDKDNHDEMAAVVIRLLKDPGLVRRLSNNARMLAEKSDWKQVRKDWERVIQEVGGQYHVRN